MNDFGFYCLTAALLVTIYALIINALAGRRADPILAQRGENAIVSSFLVEGFRGYSGADKYVRGARACGVRAGVSNENGTEERRGGEGAVLVEHDLGSGARWRVDSGVPPAA